MGLGDYRKHLLFADLGVDKAAGLKWPSSWWNLKHGKNPALSLLYLPTIRPGTAKRYFRFWHLLVCYAPCVMLKLAFKPFPCPPPSYVSLYTPDLNFMCLNICELLLYALLLRILCTHVAGGFTGKMTNMWWMWITILASFSKFDNFEVALFAHLRRKLPLCQTQRFLLQGVSRQRDVQYDLVFFRLD